MYNSALANTPITWADAQQSFLKNLSVDGTGEGNINVAVIFSKPKLNAILAQADGMAFYLCRFNADANLAFGPGNFSIIGFGYTEADGVKTLCGEHSVFEECPRPPCGSGSREGNDDHILDIPLDDAKTSYLKDLSTLAGHAPPTIDAGSLNVEVSFTKGELETILAQTDCAGIELFLCRRSSNITHAFGPGNYSMIGFGYKFVSATVKQVLGAMSVFDPTPNPPVTRTWA
jgi:hypothetical protein